MRGQVGIVPSEGRGRWQTIRTCGVAGISGKLFVARAGAMASGKQCRLYIAGAGANNLVVCGQRPCGMLSWCSGQQPGGVLRRAGTSGIGAC